MQVISVCFYQLPHTGPCYPRPEKGDLLVHAGHPHLWVMESSKRDNLSELVLGCSASKSPQKELSHIELKKIRRKILDSQLSYAC